MTFIALVPPVFFNVKQFGALGDGSTDDSTAISNCISAASGGGIVFFPPGNYIDNSGISLSNPNIRLQGAGQATTIYMGASFSGSSFINITASQCGLVDLNIRGVSTTYSSNPSGTAVQITGSRATLIQNVVISYFNGWGVQSSSGASVSNDNTCFSNVHVYNGAGGFHVLGLAASGNDQVSYISNCNVDANNANDCYLFEDAFDFVCSNIYGNCVAGSGNSIHIKGNCAALYFNNIDVGPSPGPSTGASILIESGANGTPHYIGFTNGITEGGLNGLQITAGNFVKVSNLDIFNNGTNGISVSGSSDAITIDNCHFSSNGSNTTGSRYDVSWSSTGNGLLSNCLFDTPQGTTTQKVNNVINSTAGNLTVQGNRFEGTGFTVSNIFNSFPSTILNNPGYNNALGSVTPPSITSSPATINGYSYPVVAYIKGGTVSAISVNGTTTGLTIATGGFVSVLIPAGGTITLTYSVIPTWTWFAR